MKTLTLFLLLLSCTFVNAQYTFQKKITSPLGVDIDPGNILVLPDGGFITIHFEKGPTDADTSKLFIVRLGADGQVIWQKQFISDSSLIKGYINYSDSGFIVVANTKILDTWYPYTSVLLAKIDMNGNPVWSKLHVRAGKGVYVKQLPDKRYVVVGSGHPGTPVGQNHFIMYTDSVGNALSYKGYDDTYYVGYGLPGTAMSNGNVLLYGAWQRMVMVDSSGTMLWNTSGMQDVSGTDVTETNDSALMTVSYVINGHDLVLLKYSPVGDTVMSAFLHSSLYLASTSLIQLSNGGYAISGYSYDTILPSAAKIMIVRIDADGDVLWSRNYRVSANSYEYTFQTKIQQTPDNGFIVQGVASDTTNNDLRSAIIIKTDSLGNSSCYSQSINITKGPATLIANTPATMLFPSDTITIIGFSLSQQQGFLAETDSCIVPLSSIEQKEKPVMFLYPNPVSHYLNIQSEFNGNLELKIYDNSLRKLMEHKFTGNASVNVGHLSTGLYIYTLSSRDSIIQSGKLVKE